MIQQTDEVRCAASLQLMQDMIGSLQRQYDQDTVLQFWALRLAWEAIRLAWYVVAQHNDGGKLELVDDALVDFKQQYQKQTQSCDDRARRESGSWAVWPRRGYR